MISQVALPLLVALVPTAGSIVIMMYRDRRREEAIAKREEAESDRIGIEARQLQNRLIRGNMADVAVVVDTTYKIMNLCQGVILWGLQIIAKNPEINGTEMEYLEQRRAEMQEYIRSWAEHFDSE